MIDGSCVFLQASAYLIKKPFKIGKADRNPGVPRTHDMDRLQEAR